MGALRQADRGLGLVVVAFFRRLVIDLHVMAACGFAAAPADCHEMVKPYAHMVSSKIGGRGAAREVCEFILAAQGKLEAALAPYLPAPAK